MILLHTPGKLISRNTLRTSRVNPQTRRPA